MRRIVLTLGVVVLGTSLVACGGRGINATRLGELRIKVKEGTAEPALESSWDFGSVVRGGSKVINVEATNVGQDPLTIKGVAALAGVDGDFIADQRPALIAPTLAPGASASVPVTFSPTRDGLLTTRLVFDHDADTTKPVLDLSGTGTPP